MSGRPARLGAVRSFGGNGYASRICVAVTHGFIRRCAVAVDPDLRAGFEREARAVAALEHPHICGIYDVGSIDGTHFLVMPRLDGHTLAAPLRRT